MSDNVIVIKNIYYMLSYAFQFISMSNYDKVATEEFANIYDMFAAILETGVARQLKQGLYKEYIAKEEALSTKRGKIMVVETIRKKMQRKQQLVCEFDELSENNMYNQIIKTTMILLVRQPGVDKKRIALLKKELLLFEMVDTIDPHEVHWESLYFRKNNKEYRMLLNICYLILDGLLLTTDKGEHVLASFFDEQRMCRLYEKFILGYYRYHHPKLLPNPDRIAWDVDEGMDPFLPTMQTDITLRNNDKILIIDAKYYSNNMQTQYDAQTIISANLYQIYTYVKNLDKYNTGKISGMLLYARTESRVQPNSRYKIGGNLFSVKTLDLNIPFSAISDQLETIVRDYFC